MIKNINRHIIPECFIDTNLIETLVPPDEIGRLRIYNHKKGCNAVVKEMKEEFSDNFALGIMDKDKVRLKYLDEFDKFEQQNLTLYFHKNTSKKHYIILHPPIEQWILNVAEQANISLKNYDLPTSLNKIKEITKRESSKKDEKFKQLFRDLKSNNANEIVLLTKWIKYLKVHPHDANITELQQL